MNTKQILIAAITLCMSYLVSGQDIKNPIILKYDVISLLGDQVTNSMGVKLGAEYFVTPRHAAGADLMYIFPCSNCSKPYTSIKTESTRGYSVSLFYRYYIHDGIERPEGFYLGPHASYQRTQSEMWEGSDEFGENLYQVYRDLLSFHLMAGYQLNIAGPVYFDPSLGLGVRYISSRSLNKLGTGGGVHEFPYDKDFESGSKWFPSLCFSIKIGIKL